MAGAVGNPGFSGACGGRPAVAGATEMADETPPTPHHQHLIFHWKPLRGARRRLAAALLLAGAAHAGLFYLFRVVPGNGARTLPPRLAVVQLVEGDPATRVLVNAVEDRFPGTLLRSPDAAWARDVAALAAVVPPLFPRGEGSSGELKPYNQPLVPEALPPSVVPGQVLMPPLEGVERATPSTVTAPELVDSGEEEPPVVRPRPNVQVSAAGRARRVTRKAAWPDGLVDEAWPETASIPFMLGVDAAGRPVWGLPLVPVSGVDLEALRRPLMEMRFEPMPGAAVEWVEADVRW